MNHSPGSWAYQVSLSPPPPLLMPFMSLHVMCQTLSDHKVARDQKLRITCLLKRELGNKASKAQLDGEYIRFRMYTITYMYMYHEEDHAGPLNINDIFT